MDLGYWKILIYHSPQPNMSFFRADKNIPRKENYHGSTESTIEAKYKEDENIRDIPYTGYKFIIDEIVFFVALFRTSKSSQSSSGDTEILHTHPETQYNNFPWAIPGIFWVDEKNNGNI